MAGPDTIQADLSDRLDRYHQRYGSRHPKKGIPVTLDEWAWLSEAQCVWIPERFMGVQLRLVEAVFETSDGGVGVKP